MAERFLQSRRKFLIGAGSGAALTLLGYDVVKNELMRGEPDFPEAQYIIQILAKPSTPSHPFGIYSDRLTEDLRNLNNTFTGIDLVGSFAAFDLIFNENYQAELFGNIRKSYENKSIPVASMGMYHQIDGAHPLDKKVQDKLAIVAEANAIIFKDNLTRINHSSKPLFVRFMYEQNLLAFAHGKGNGLTDKEHVNGFKRSLYIFKNKFAKHGLTNVEFAFSPYVDNDFAKYYTPDFDLVGFDAYDPIPLEYITKGKRWARQIIEPSIKKIQELTHGEKQLYMWEIGSFSGNARWLYEASLVAFANGAQGIMHFNYDKSKGAGIRETNWRMTYDMIQVYKFIIDLVNKTGKKA